MGAEIIAVIFSELKSRKNLHSRKKFKSTRYQTF